MSDPVPFVGLLVIHAAQCAIIACFAWLTLRDVRSGAARSRLRFALFAFYGAALLPLTAVLPHALSATLGPSFTPLAAWQAPVIPTLGGAMESICAALLAIVAIGVLVRLIRTGIAIVRGERLMRSARALSPLRYGLAPHVRIAASNEITGPALVGLWTPTILLPHRLVNAAPEQISLLLKHETNHLHRGDVWNALLQRLVEDALWWNPAIRVLGLWLTEQREMTCDEIDLKADERTLAGALIREARVRVAPSLLAASARGGNIERRIERLLSTKRRRGRMSAVALTLVLLAIGAVSTPRASTDSVTMINIASH